MNFEELRPETEEEWLQIRRGIITASEIGVILGLNPWKSAADIMRDKENPRFFENAWTWTGQELEPKVVSYTNKALGTSFRLYETDTRSIFVDKELRLGATPDATDDKMLLECKSTKPGNLLKWAHWPPAYYLSQLYLQLMAVDFQKGYLTIMKTDLTQHSSELYLPLVVFELTRTEELDNLFLERVSDFWRTIDSGKMYRVPRKDAPRIELQLRFQTKQVFE